MIQRLQELSLRSKLSTIILSGIGTALAVSFVLLLLADRAFVRASMARELGAVADVLSENCAAAVAFQDRKAASENLAALTAVPDVRRAVILTSDGHLFAAYPASAGEPVTPTDRAAPSPGDRGNHRFDSDGLWLTREIRLGQRHLGTLVLRSDLGRLHDRTVQYSKAMATILLVALLVGLAISRRLQLWITRPIERLVGTAQRISVAQDYSLRAVREGGDEIGDLVDSFNQMVARVEQRDRELRDHKERLEEMLEERLAELRGTEEQLRQAQKMEAIGRLAGGIAHDFNNLLTAINGYSDLVLSDPSLDAGLREHVVEIVKAGERAAALTRQLLAFSRKQVLEEKAVDLNQALRDLHNMLVRLIGEHIIVRLDLEPELGAIRADPGQIQQVILNLAVNARDAMPDGGMLTLRTRSGRIPPSGSAEHPGVAPGRYALLRVEDTGTGIAPEIQSRVFEPFFTTKAEGEGTGLGLSTVYGVLKQSGGNIALESRPGEGTTFVLYLPVMEQETTAEEGTEGRPEPPSGRGTILLVEDQERVRRLVETMLSRSGYSVLAAPHPDEARRLFRSHRDEIDLLLTDVVMPGMSGRDLAALLRNERPDLGVLFVSGYPQNNSSPSASSTPFSAPLLMKPFTRQDLLAAVGRALRADGQPGQPGTAREAPGSPC